ncbi:MAG: hypothetical protein D3922_15320 [Candidatus Electrothrix sp. AR1]|nr:hypothetical protein [Candidatus Electrothrix sp. AR1]
MKLDTAIVFFEKNMREDCNDNRNSFIRQVKGLKRAGVSRLNTAGTTGWNKKGLLAPQPFFLSDTRRKEGRAVSAPISFSDMEQPSDYTFSPFGERPQRGVMCSLVPVSLTKANRAIILFISVC